MRKEEIEARKLKRQQKISTPKASIDEPATGTAPLTPGDAVQLRRKQGRAPAKGAEPQVLDDLLEQMARGNFRVRRK